MRQLFALPAALALAACAGTPPAGTPNAAGSTGDTTAPAAGEAGDCLAYTAKARPAGWVDAGELVVNVADRKPTSVEVHDASGKLLETTPVDNTSPETMRRSINLAICKAGGYLGVVSGDRPTTGTTRIAVIRPEKEDEPADLTLLCSEPGDIPAEFDLSQKVVVARDIYGESLTSKRYRTWLRSMDAAVKTDDKPAKLRLLDELTAQAKSAGKPTCWFPDVLRKGALASP